MKAMCSKLYYLLPELEQSALPESAQMQKLPISCRTLAEYLPNNVVENLTPAETAFLSSLLSIFEKSEWITNAEAREATGKSDGSVKRFMRNLTDKFALEAKGVTGDRKYRLLKKGR